MLLNQFLFHLFGGNNWCLCCAGLYRLEISHSPLSDIPDEAFSGLERSLWELLLHHNELVEIPSHAIRHLRKLRHLDLSGNGINCIEQDSFRGLEDSLQILNLADNSINTLPPDSFGGLPNLDTIDLSGNNLAHIEANVFRDGMPRLAKVLLIFTFIFYYEKDQRISLHFYSDLAHFVGQCAARNSIHAVDTAEKSSCSGFVIQQHTIDFAGLVAFLRTKFNAQTNIGYNSFGIQSYREHTDRFICPLRCSKCHLFGWKSDQVPRR